MQDKKQIYTKLKKLKTTFIQERHQIKNRCLQQITCQRNSKTKGLPQYKKAKSLNKKTTYILIMSKQK